MIIDTLEKVRDYIVANGLDAGYNVRFFYIDDTRDKGLPVLLIKTSGTGSQLRLSGAQQSIINGTDIEICMVNDRRNTKSMFAALDAIRLLFIRFEVAAGLVGYELQSPVSPPAMMDDDRVMIRFSIRVFDQDYE